MDEMEKRIHSEAEAIVRITNNDLVCKDCQWRSDDTEIFGNTSRCVIYRSKPNQVLLGGKCNGYFAEQD